MGKRFEGGQGVRFGFEKKQGRGAMTTIQPEEFKFYSERIGGATALAANGVVPMVTQREGT